MRPLGDAAMLERMLLCVPVADAAKAELLQLMRGADRHYHNATHLTTLWRRHRRLSPRTGMAARALQPRLAAAILWHDAIYVAGRRDNEAQSAALWRARAAGGGFDAATIEWVASTIVATADHMAPRAPCDSLDARSLQWVLDLDLTPIGEPPDDFARNTQRLAREFEGAGAGAWEQQRLGFLRRLAACPQIYRSPAIAAAYEAQARANIERELALAG